MRYTAARQGSRMSIEVTADDGETIPEGERRTWSAVSASAGAERATADETRLTAVIGRRDAQPLIDAARRVIRSRRR